MCSDVTGLWSSLRDLETTMISHHCPIISGFNISNLTAFALDSGQMAERGERHFPLHLGLKITSLKATGDFKKVRTRDYFQCITPGSKNRGNGNNIHSECVA